MININDSPGAMVNIVKSDQIITNQDSYDTASAIHRALDKIAGLIRNFKAEKIILESDFPEPQSRLQFDQGNQDNFLLPVAESFEETPVEFECNIYRFNKKSLNGFLEYFDREEIKNLPFKANENLLESCLDAFRAPRVKVTAYREMEINALGETKIKKVHLISVSPNIS